ncbi:hypothetical protein [Clostridioides difficile]|nr:hypothetical protein [Clostridioides difficile]
MDENVNKYIRIKGTITRSFFVLKCDYLYRDIVS